MSLYPDGIWRTQDGHWVAPKGSLSPASLSIRGTLSEESRYTVRGRGMSRPKGHLIFVLEGHLKTPTLFRRRKLGLVILCTASRQMPPMCTSPNQQKAP